MMNNEKSYLRMGAIIGVIIGVILMIITLSINHSNAGILTGVFCLLVSGILGIVIGSIIQILEIIFLMVNILHPS